MGLPTREIPCQLSHHLTHKHEIDRHNGRDDELWNGGVVESSNDVVFESSYRRMVKWCQVMVELVEWWSGRIVESFSGGMVLVEWWSCCMELSNRPIVGWWNGA